MIIIQKDRYLYVSIARHRFSSFLEYSLPIACWQLFRQKKRTAALVVSRSKSMRNKPHFFAKQAALLRVHRLCTRSAEPQHT